MTELKPCPFCGEKAKLIKYSNGYGGNPVHIKHSFYVKCTKCGVSGEFCESDIWQDDDGSIHVKNNGAEEAIEAWNRRAEDETD